VSTGYFYGGGYDYDRFRYHDGYDFDSALSFLPRRSFAAADSRSPLLTASQGTATTTTAVTVCFLLPPSTFSPSLTPSCTDKDVDQHSLAAVDDNKTSAVDKRGELPLPPFLFPSLPLTLLPSSSGYRYDDYDYGRDRYRHDGYGYGYHYHW
jgi:hypothetical protein